MSYQYLADREMFHTLKDRWTDPPLKFEWEAESSEPCTAYDSVLDKKFSATTATGLHVELARFYGRDDS